MKDMGFQRSERLRNDWMLLLNPRFLNFPLFITGTVSPRNSPGENQNFIDFAFCVPFAFLFPLSVPVVVSEEEEEEEEELWGRILLPSARTSLVVPKQQQILFYSLIFHNNKQIELLRGLEPT